MIIDWLEEWFKGVLIDGIIGNLSGLFDTVNTKVGEIAADVGATPQGWNSGIFNMIRNLSESVIIPIAGAILAFVMTYELIQMVTEKNNLHDIDTFMFFKWVFKTYAAVLIVTNTWNIVMGVFDAAQQVVNQSAGVIIGNTSIDIDSIVGDLQTSLEAMSLGGLIGLWFQSLFVGLTMNILSICIMLVVYGRMIEIYLVTSLGPIPLATMTNGEWRNVGQNYLKSLLALGFQAFLIMGEPNVLTGKIYCADCGAPMYNHRQRKGRERIYYTTKGEKRISHSNPADCYECSTYNLAYQKYDRHCTCHHISTKALKSIILKTIQETCHYVSLNEQEFVYSLQEESAMKDIAVSETVKKRIERNQKRVHELDMLIRKIYEDNVIGRLPDRLFQSMLTDYENEQNELNKIIETDTADMQRIIGGQNNVERFLKLVKKYENITELTPAMINEFIDKILVHEPQGKGADRTTEVEIYLNYVGQFQVPVEQHEPTEEERIAAEKEADRLRRKRESNRKYMKKIREKSKKFAEHERIAEENNSDSKLCAEQNATSKSNRQKVKGEKIA